jgi:hypothetical protein
LNSGIACHHSIQKLLSSRLLSKTVEIKIYKTVTLPKVLNGYETWSLILEEEHRLRVIESRVLGKIFRTKRDEAIRCWRKLHNEELHNLYSSPNIIRMIKSRKLKFAQHLACMRKNINAYRVSVGMSEERIPLGRYRSRWENNIKTDFIELG